MALEKAYNDNFSIETINIVKSLTGLDRRTIIGLANIYENEPDIEDLVISRL